jgi:Gpi18-like mannosyltransferase
MEKNGHDVHTETPVLETETPVIQAEPSETKKPVKPLTVKMVISVLVGVALVKLLLCLFSSDAIDMPGYKAWSMHLATRGFDDFYQTWHVVYGPAYMYLLWISGKLATIFSLSTKTHEVLIKFWSVCSDLLGAYLIYLIGKKRGKERLGLWLGVAYALNPAIFFNSCIWGQFESVAATMLLAVVYCFTQGMGGTAVIIFTVAVLTKPQSAMLAPIVFILFLKNFSWRNTLFAFVGGICAYVALMLPFSTGRSILWFVEHTIKSGGDYPYATANGFNLWTILGGQTIPDNQMFHGLSYATWGLLLIAFLVIVTCLIMLRFKISDRSVYYASYLLCFGVFLFGSRMHERYLFPALIFFIVTILWDIKLWVPAAVLSLAHLGNIWYIYIRAWQQNVWAPPNDPLALVIAWVTLAVFVYSLYYIVKRDLKVGMLRLLKRLKPKSKNCEDATS